MMIIMIMIQLAFIGSRYHLIHPGMYPLGFQKKKYVTSCHQNPSKKSGSRKPGSCQPSLDVRPLRIAQQGEWFQLHQTFQVPKMEVLTYIYIYVYIYISCM